MGLYHGTERRPHGEVVIPPSFTDRAAHVYDNPQQGRLIAAKDNDVYSPAEVNTPTAAQILKAINGENPFPFAEVVFLEDEAPSKTKTKHPPKFQGRRRRNLRTYNNKPRGRR